MTEPVRWRAPDPGEPVPVIAWPTLLLFCASLIIWVAALLSGVARWIPAPVAVAAVAIASYGLFTVAHDAAHHCASSARALNRWMGRVATPLFAPVASFAVWRFIHMQHHRFTNHDDGRDPDHYTMAGPAWQRPLRLLTIDLHYVGFYLPHLRSRPAGERRAVIAQYAALAAVVALTIGTANVGNLLLFVLLPQRIALVWLAYAFDYLPHHGLHHWPEEHRLRTTRNRVGGERWVSPLLLYQNYHLVHHIHPVVPFYRYLRVWRRGEARYLEGDPALSTLSGRPLTVEEYRHCSGG